LRVLVRRGAAEFLEKLAAGEALTPKKLKELNMSKYTLKVLVREGLIEVKSEEMLVREETLKVKRTLYELTDRGRRILKLYRSLDEEDLDVLRITGNQVKIMESLSEGARMRRELPNKYGVYNLVKRGFVKRGTVEREEPRKIYVKRRVYKITEKGKKAYELYDNLRTL